MKTVALGEVVDFYSGGTPPKSRGDLWEGDTPWFSAKDMKRPRLTDSVDHVSDAVFTSTPLRKLPAGTVALVVRGMILAHTVPIAILEVDAAINQDLKALLPRREMDPSFLAAMLRAQHAGILAQVSTAAHGTKKLESRVLENIRIPLPPIVEQRRIAAILDHVDALRAKRCQVLAHLDALTQAIFGSMFDGISDVLPLSAVVEEFRYGTSNKSGNSGYPVLRIPNVVGGSLNLEEVKTVEVAPGELERLRLRRGDLLFVRSNGNPDYVGRCAVFTPDLVEGAGYPVDDWVYASYLIRARLAEGYNPDFIAAFLAGPEGKRQLRERSKTSAGQYNVNTEGLGSILIPAAPSSRQEEFAVRLQAVRSAGLLVEREPFDSLLASIQSRAFRGEL